MIFVTMVVLQYLYLIKEEEFVNALSQGLLTKTKAEHHTTSAYHSQVHKCALYLITFHA